MRVAHEIKYLVAAFEQIEPAEARADQRVGTA